MSLRNLQVRDVMAVEQAPVVQVRSSPPFELLVGLYALCSPQEAREPSWVPPELASCRPATRAAIESVGERSGEMWLHLLGIPLDAQAATAAEFLAAIEALPPLELRRHLVGVHVPAWRKVVGKAALEAAARGDAAASKALLAHPVYYAGRSRESLRGILPLSADETKRRLVCALRTFADEVFEQRESQVAGQLEEDARSKRRLQSTIGPLELIDRAAGGYLYEVEPEFERVLLVPHLAARPWLLLCQHRRARIICYAVRSEAGEPAERLLELGRALGDSRRLMILQRLRKGDASLAELAGELGLAKSTTHHHLHRLRAANLIALRGNAAGYRYTLEPSGFAGAERLLGEFPLGY
jgi:DNA-binding transcriptional ArsR family regulator